MAAGGAHLRQLTGLADGLVVVIKRAGQEHPQVQQFVAGSVRVEEAGDLLALLSIEAEAGVALGGALHNRAQVESVDRVSHLVALFKDRVVPELLHAPTRAPLLRVVKGCALSLRAHALVAGGSFGTLVRGFATQIEEFLERASAHPVYAPYNDLRASIEDLRRHAASLLQRTCTVRDLAFVAAAAQEAAAEEEDEEDDDA